MSYELFYTSVPQGLRPGSRGFCTVGLTRGTPAALVERLESLSGYRPLFPVGSPQAEQNPVSWAHWRISTSSATFSVVSRVAFAGTDYTRRSNKFAHHIALTSNDRPAGGPACLLLQPGYMASEWKGEPTEYNAGPVVPACDLAPASCKAWEAACGDAGWAAVLAASAGNADGSPTYLIYRLGTDMLRLIAEALALLPKQQRWQVTFNTYFTDLPAGMSCAWRCSVAGTPAAEEAVRSGCKVIDLTTRLPTAPQSALAQFARTGVTAKPGPGNDDGATIGLLDESESDRAAVASVRTFPALANAAVGRPALNRPSVAVSAVEPSQREDQETVDRSWMPPLEGSQTESASANASADPRNRNWTVLLAAITVWTILVTGVVYSVMKQQVNKLKDQLGALSIQHQQDLGDEFARGQSQPDPSKWLPVVDAKSKIDQARREGLTEGMAAPDPALWSRKPGAPVTPAVVVAPDKPANPPPVADAAPPKENAPAGLAKPITGASETNYFLDISAVAAGDGRQLLLHLPDSAAGAHLRFKPGVVSFSADGSAPQCSSLGATALSVFILTLGLGEKREFCRFAIDHGALWLEWPALSATDDASRKAFLKAASVAIGDIAIQFSAPDEADFSLSDKSPASAKPLALSAAGDRKLTMLQVQPPWVVQPVSDSRIRLTTNDKSPDDALSFDLKLDGTAMSSGWQSLLDRKMTLLKEATNRRDAAAAQATSLTTGTSASARLAAAAEVASQEEDVASKENQVQELKSFPPAVAAITANNGIILRIINVKVGK